MAFHESRLNIESVGQCGPLVGIGFLPLWIQLREHGGGGTGPVGNID